MKGIFKKIILFALIGAVIYTLLSYHFIIVGKKVKLLKKSSYNMDYIFYSTEGKRLETILGNDVLWTDGIGDLLVKEGRISEEKLELYKEKREEKDNEY